MFDKIITKFRKHDFNFVSPLMIKVDGTNFYYYKYICKNCGYSLSLDEWQMRDLPFDMKRGCPGK